MENKESNQIINRIISLLSKLPGVGNRSSRRILFYLMQRKEQLLIPLAKQLEILSEEIKICSICGNIDVQEPCNICSNNKRSNNIICIVEDISSLWALEKSKAYTGIYFVLGGTLSSLIGKTPEEIKIPKLLQYLEKNQTIEEVILALPATIEGQTTSLYIKEQISSLNKNINITTLAQGVPAGGEIDYLDELTLGTALKLRKEI